LQFGQTLLISGVKSMWRSVRDKLFRFAYRRRVVERDGIQLIVDHPAISDRMYYVLCRRYEQKESERSVRYLLPSDRVLEVGAGVGWTALRALKSCGMIDYAVVEANPSVFPLLQENLRLNGRTIPAFHAAITPVSGPQDFHLHRDFWSSSVHVRNGMVATASVPGLTLRDVTASLQFRPNALVMDIEGGEIDIADEDWLLFEKVLLEVHVRIVGSESVAQLEDRLAALGFTHVEPGVFLRH
jgi:FkbM family methyltransferase